ncbi:RHS repeat-associated core domain-containing protein [Amycolatopsis sp. NPDC004079]|uniref:RHS repeat-associated core domain-containing protein n=1 Tax=Amycolatopsis sp. NPDC004079 TaxID=3154549 RepID=UPI0033A28CDC
MLASGANSFTYDGTSSTLTGDGAHTYSRGPSGGLLAVGSANQAALAFTDAHGDFSATYTAGAAALDGSTAYGQVTAQTGNTYGLGYQGGWTSPTTGDVATASRWYDPTTGSFTSQDSQLTLGGNAVTANQYAYGDDDPLDNLDPTGNSSCHRKPRPGPHGPRGGPGGGPEPARPAPTTRAASAGHTTTPTTPSERGRSTNC